MEGGAWARPPYGCGLRYGGRRGILRRWHMPVQTVLVMRMT